MIETNFFPYYIYRVKHAGEDIYFKNYADAKEFFRHYKIEDHCDHITAVLLHTKPFWDFMEISDERKEKDSDG